MVRCVLTIVAVAVGTKGICDEVSLPIDLLIKNARVWTGDPKKPEATSIAVANGRIYFIGPSEAAEHLPGRPFAYGVMKWIDAKGQRIVPGFYDSHVHLLGTGMRLGQVALKDAKDEEEFGRLLQEFDRKLPRDRWMLGGNWDHDRALKGELPTAALLDKYVKDRPVFLNRYDGHMAVAN